MIAVRIPDEIRKYKEKILFGMTSRQLIFTILAFAVCVPLFWWGKDVILEDVLFIMILIIAGPLLAIGWISFEGGHITFGSKGMPMEKYFMIWMRTEVLHPKKRVYRTKNAFRTWQNMAYEEERPKGTMEKRIMEKLKKDENLEKLFLLDEAEKDGRATYTTDVEAERAASFDMDAQELPDHNKKKRPLERMLKLFGGKGPKKDNNKNDKNKEKAKSRLQLQAEEIEAKKKENPQYVPTDKEFKILAKWNNEKNKARIKEIQKGKKQIAKKGKDMEKRRKAKTAIPRSTQDSIPYVADYEEGLFEVTPNKYSKMYKIKDINYKTGREEEQVTIFCRLGEFLNYFSEEMHFAWIIDNRVISKEEQERKVFKHEKGDKYDRHRKEYNNVIRRQIVAGRNDIQTEKYVTVTIDADSPIDALLRFHKIDAEIITNLRKIGSDGKVVSTDDRLEYYHDKFRKGHEGEFETKKGFEDMDFYEFLKVQGLSSKDYIAPSFMKFDRKHFQIDDDYYRCMFLTNLPASLADDFLFELADNDFPATISLSIEAVAQDKGLQIVKKQLTGIEANKIDAEKKAIRAGYNPETIKHEIKDAHEQALGLYDDMMNKNQKMFFVTITVMAHGATLEELDENCKILMSKARKYTAQLQVLSSQQEEAFRTTLPFGYVPQELCVERTLTTESTAIFMPFSNQELFQKGGFYYGLNQISQNLVVVNRTKMKTPSGFVLGSSGSGKSFATKREILNVLLDDDKTNVLVIDPENEYCDFCRAFGGSILKISSDTDNYVNPMDMTREYGLDEDDDINTVSLESMKEKAVKKKSEYIMSIVERMISSGGTGDTTTITPQQKTIVDRAVRATYKAYLDSNFDPALQPTLLDFQDELDKEGLANAEAKALAEGVEYYTRGSMNIFAHHTNVDINNRLVVFSIRDLGEQLRQIALVIVFDFIWTRMTQNKNKNVRTYCYCDEVHVMFQSYYAAEYLRQLYKRGRKYGLVITGITQNVEEILRSEKAKSMIGNSDFILMLNQYSEDLKILAKMLNISENQMGYVAGVDAGEGLLFAEKVIVPFVDRFPEDSYLYSLMSTKFGEDKTREEIDAMIAEIMEEKQVELPPTEEEIEEQVLKMHMVE